MKVLLNDTPEKKDFRENKLPKVPLTRQILFPKLLELFEPIMIEALKAEIEIYKAFPKNNSDPKRSIFNPRNPNTCFMGLGFNKQGMGDFGDADLAAYRNAIGTINHPVWGNCTLLEIWGGDHFVPAPEMVLAVFDYCYGKRKTLPKLKFLSVPFIKTEFTGTMILGEDQRQECLEDYLITYNGIRLNYGLDAMTIDELPKEALEDFEHQFQQKLKGEGL